MINKSDALAQFEAYMKDPERTEVRSVMDGPVRTIIEALFDGREQMTSREAQVCRLILTAANTALIAAHRVALEAGDWDDDEPDVAEVVK